MPVFLAKTARAASHAKDSRVLVVVQLDGGNDALNTIVPYNDPNYARLRPTLAVRQNDLIRLSDTLGMHPALRPLGGLLEAGQLAVVPGVGYPNPSRSHFTGMAVWHTARLDPADHTGYGWLGRALDPAGASSYAIHGSVPGSLRGRRSRAITMLSTDEMRLASAAVPENAARLEPVPADSALAFVRRQALDGYSTSARLAALTQGADAGTYPSTELAGRLQLVARLLRANLGARVFYTVQRGYDTHASQRFAHANLLGEFARAVAAFYADLRSKPR